MRGADCADTDCADMDWGDPCVALGGRAPPVPGPQRGGWSRAGSSSGTAASSGIWDDDGAGSAGDRARLSPGQGMRGLPRQDPSVPGGGGGWSLRLCCVAVPGAWEEWSPWSLCSVTCGRGARTRTRRCVASRRGGKACEGPELQAKPCNIAICPGQYLPLPTLLLPAGNARRQHWKSARAALPLL